MNETPEDLRALQELIDTSLAAQKSSNLKEIFPAQYALTAGDIVALFPETRVVALATVTAKCEPRVVPVDVLFYRGHFYHPADIGSLRAKLWKRNPHVSLTYFDPEDNAVIVHGTVTIIDQQHPEFGAVDQFRRSMGRVSLREWSSTAFYARVDANRIFGKFGPAGPPSKL